MKKQITLVSVGLISAALFLTSYSSGPGGLGVAASSAPGEQNCTTCHSGNALNSGAGSVDISVDGGITEYTPSMTYNVTVTATGSSVQRYGFQASAQVFSDQSAAGTFTAGTGTKVSTVGGKSYIEHSSTSTTGSWSFSWQAPATDVGSIVFYVAGNSAENPAGNQGDFIYTKDITLRPAVSTSVNDQNEVSNELSIYPNPGNSVISVSFYTTTSQTLSISVLDLSGKTVKNLAQTNSFNSGVNTVTMDVSELAAGTYIVKVSGDQYLKSSTLLVGK